MKIYTQGARFYGGQIDRIDQGFKALGHELTPYIDEADLAYVNNGPYRQIASDKFAGRIKGKLILTVLDIPVHLLPNFDMEGLYAELQHADQICVISEYVQSQLKNYFRLDSKVIYNPIKPIFRDPIQRTSPLPLFLHVGRRYDPNKRFNLGVQALKSLGVNYHQLALAGSEAVTWGETLGVLTDPLLNSAYNAVDFVMATSKVEGLNLPVCEAMAAGVIPVVCNDMTTREELLPSAIFPEYLNVDPVPESVALFIKGFIDDREKMKEFKDRLHRHYLKNWEKILTPEGVAQSILETYESTKTN